MQKNQTTPTMAIDPNMVIEGECKGAELDKRTYLPGIFIKSKCPKCGAPYEDDLSDSYLSYPKVGKPHKLAAYCGACEHEWTLGSVVVNFTLTPVEGDSPVWSPNEQQAKSMVASMLDDLESPLREAVRAELSPDDCTHEDADHALDALQRVLRGNQGA